MEIHFGSDHRGYDLKRAIIDYLTEQGHTCTDHGCDSTDRAEYPVFAKLACEPLAAGNPDVMAIVVCGSGVGVSITANKMPNTRCVLCWCEHIAEYGRRHNHANCLAFSGDLLTFTTAKRCLDAFFAAEEEGDRHARRVAMINELD